MRFFALLIGTACSSVADPCTILCQRDGPLICNEGSFNKNGVCHRYLFRGDPSLNDYCYHTKYTAAQCPSSGKPVKVADAQRLLGIRQAQRQEVLPPRIDVPPVGGDHLRHQQARASTTTSTTTTTPRDFGHPMYVDPLFAQLEHLMVEFGLTVEEALDMMAQDQIPEDIPPQQPNVPQPPRINGRTPAPPAVDIQPKLSIQTTQSPAELVALPLYARMEAVRAEVNKRLNPDGRFASSCSISTSRERTLIDSLELLNGPLQAFTSDRTIDIKFTGEPGYGPGMTKEWISELTRQLFSPESGFFVLSDSAPLFYKINPTGLSHPRAREIYRAAGRFLALSLIRNHPLGINLPVMFFGKLLDQQLTLDDVKIEEELLVKSFRILLSFSEEDLIDSVYVITIDGVDIVVTSQNRAELVLRKVNSLITPDQVPMFDLIKQGFNEAIPTSRMSALFKPAEVKALILGNPEIDIEDFFAHATIRIDDMNQRNMFRNVLTGFNQEQRRKFLRFTTNLSQTPIGGFARIEPKVYIHGGKYYAQHKMPRVYLCTHSVLLPEYRDEAEMREMILLAIEAGNGWL